MEKQKIDLQFPKGGIVKSGAYWNEEVQTSPYGMNVRPYDVYEGRSRGGSRPCLERFATAPSTGPCRLLTTVNVKTGDKYDYWEDCLQYDDASHYSTVVGVGGSAIPTFERGEFYIDPDYEDPGIGFRTSGSAAFPYTNGMNFSAAFRVGVHATGIATKTGSYILIAGDYITGFYFKFALNGGAGPEISAYSIAGGVHSVAGVVSQPGTQVLADGWLEMECNGTSASLYHRGELLLTRTYAAGFSGLSSAGFIIESTGTGRVSVDRIRLQYYRTSQYETVRPKMVYSQGGTLYRDSFVGKLTATSATRTLASDRQLMAAERGGLLFIADHSEALASGSDGAITGTNAFDSATYSNWSTTLTGYDKSDIGLVVLSANTPTTFNSTNGNLISVPVHVRITVTHGTMSLYSVSGLSFVQGDGYTDATMEFTGLPSAVLTAMDGMVYKPESAYSTAYTITVSRLVDGEIVETSVTSATSSGSNQTYSTGTANLITFPESTTPYYIRLTVTNGTLTLASTSGLTLYNGATGSSFGQVLFSGSPTNVNAALNGMVYTPVTNYQGVFTVTLERLINSIVVEKNDYSYTVSQGNKCVGFHAISNIAAGNLTIPTSANGTALNFRIERAPKVYDPVNDTLTLWTAQNSYGMVPVGCTMIARYRDRLVLSGDPLDPNEWYMSRQGDPYDWLFTDVDVGASVKGSASDAGRIGDAVTALMTFNDDYMFFGCRSSLWILRGDPTAGGKIDSVSRSIGVLDRQSWCAGPSGEIIWLSREGLWMTNPECLSCTPVPVSRDTLPRELMNINPATAYVSMVYDVVDRGVHIYLTPRISSLTDTSRMPDQVTHWFLDWRTKGLFPVSFADKSFNPTCCLAYSGLSSADSTALMAGYNGSIYRYSWASQDDDGSVMSSHVALGPFRLGDGIRDGMVREIRGTLGSDSGDVNWGLYVERTPEDAAKSTDDRFSGTWTEGHRNSAYPMSRGEAGLLKLSSTVPWAMESVSIVTGKGGRARGDL